MESVWSPVGSTSHPTPKKIMWTPCGVYVESWSPRGSMGQGKVHPSELLLLLSAMESIHMYKYER